MSKFSHLSTKKTKYLFLCYLHNTRCLPKIHEENYITKINSSNAEFVLKNTVIL